LRVDVDGPRTTNRVSADYFRSEGAKTTYFGSMRVDEPVVTISHARVVIRGVGLFTWPARHLRVAVEIPCATDRSPPAAATLRHFTTGGSAGSVYTCAHESSNFRTVLLEQAREKAGTAFASYDTGLLASGGPARALSAVSAFAEAGIELHQDGEAAVIDSSTSGANAAWSDAELHAAMEAGFSRWADIPQWAVWLLHAVTHEDPDIFGLMFDRKGAPRQGCAVFYQGLIAASRPEIARELLHVCVHELGHGFNLLHSWQRSLEKPPVPSRPAAHSWMNYPDRFPGGRDAFWSAFAFEFDDVELAHLRHGFRESVIMGGEPFAGSSAFARAERWDAEQQDNELRLKLHAQATLAQGVPVTVGLELSTTAREGRMVAPVLGPRPRTVEIAIRDPRGNELTFEPLLQHCRGEKLVRLRASDTPIRDFAFIHYGKKGFAFADPGTYRLRARYTGPDGALALSDEVTIRVVAPVTRADREVARLIADDDQVGTLMSVVGSDARTLSRGNQKLRRIMERYPTHPVADIARVIQGTNLARGFKTIAADGSVTRRAPDIAGAMSLVDGVVDVAQLLRMRPADGGLGPAAPPVPDIMTRREVVAAVNAFVNARRGEVGRAVPPPARRLTGDRVMLPPPRRLRRRGRRNTSTLTVNETRTADATEPAPGSLDGRREPGLEWPDSAG
jgi:hypothetical protein